MESQPSFVRGALEAVGIVTLFIGGGLGWAALLGAGSLPLPAGSGAPGLFDLRSAGPSDLRSASPRCVPDGLPRCARPPGTCLYPPAVEETRPAPQLWLVDGYNVLNVGLLAGRPREGWWSSQLREELLGRAERFDASDAEIWVVFDGPRPADAPAEGRVRSVFAPSADDWLLAQIPDRGATSPPVRVQEPGRVALVTADRRLASRARQRGAEIVAPAAFLARCRELGA